MSNQPQTHYKSLLGVLMMTIMIELMSFMLIFPLMPVLFLSGSQGMVAAHSSEAWRYFCYSIALASWPLGNFFGTAYLGELSDRFGRKRILMSCLSMVSISYFIAAFSVIFSLPILFFLSRILAGFFGGSYDIAQAAIADISPGDLKARNMSLATFAASMGLILGPLIASFSSSTLLHWHIPFTMPFWVAGGLSFLNVLWIFFVFQETFVPRAQGKLVLSKVFTSCRFVFVDPRVRRLGMVFFLFVIAWGFYIQQIPAVMQSVFHFNAHLIGFFFLVLGVGFALSILFIQPALLKHYRLEQIYKATIVITGILVFVATLLLRADVEWVTAFLVGIFEIIAYGTILAAASNRVSDNEQGRVMGGIGAVASIGFFVTGLSLWLLSEVSITLPIYLAAGAFVLSGFLMRDRPPVVSEEN